MARGAREDAITADEARRRHPVDLVAADGDNSPASDVDGADTSTNVVWLFTDITAPVDTSAYSEDLGRLWVLDALVNGEGGNVENLFTTLPDSILRIGATPHDWLFPRTAAVIHHGGSGTTHSATRAGKPSVVVPFAGDQSFWADRLARLGIAQPARDGAGLKVSNLAAAIGFVEQAPVRARAEQLGARMAQEDGLGTAVSAIEALLGR